MKNDSQQLQISEFIKDPVSLKLLILAGTNIKSSQLITVAKCVSLIKLDLSSNSLIHIPIKFTSFSQLKILFLHDNQLQSIDIKKTTLQYITLFSNPVKNYRKQIVQQNDKLLGLDYNMITQQEKYTSNIPPYSKIKWPLVQISTHLENQQDYLNLLKAEIFVINNLNKRTNGIEKIKQYLDCIKEKVYFNNLIKQFDQQKAIKTQNIRKFAQIWQKNVFRKQKLRDFLAKRNKQHLMYNRLQIRSYKLSPQAKNVVKRFIQSIRQIMVARKVLQKHIRSYKNSIPIQKNLSIKLSSQNTKIYLKNRQLYMFEKICLYLKKLLFKQKQYDLCDSFDQIVKPSGKNYILFKQPQRHIDEKSWLMCSIHQSLQMVMRQKNLDRRSVLYDRAGHKAFKIKQKNRLSLNKKNQNKYLETNLKLLELQRSYSTLVQYKISNPVIFMRLIRLIRFFNSGNQDKILMNRAAYFQTEVIFDEENEKSKPYLFIGIQSIMKRVISANIIQRWWRKKMDIQKSKIQVIQAIKKNRAQFVIKRWLKNIHFQRRVILSKVHSYQESIWKDTQLYFHLSIYMNIPEPKNFIRKQNLELKDLYKVIHTGTQIQIVQSFGRKWIRIKFSSSKQAYKAITQMNYLTYRYYYNGFSLKFFTNDQIRSQQILLDYQRKVKHIFQIDVPYQKSENKVSKSLWIQNSDPFFIWPQLEKSVKSFFQVQSQSFPINMFIYNRYKRPLKVNCQLNWVNPESLYKNKKKNRILVRSAQKVIVQSKIEDKRELLQYYLPHIKHHREKRNSIGVSQHSSLLKSGRKRGYSQMVNFKVFSQTMNLNKK